MKEKIVKQATFGLTEDQMGRLMSLFKENKKSILHTDFVSHMIQNNCKIGNYIFHKKPATDHLETFGIYMDNRYFSNKKNLVEINVVSRSEIDSPRLQSVELNIWYMGNSADSKAVVKNKKEQTMRDFFGSYLDVIDDERVNTILKHYNKFYNLSVPNDYEQYKSMYVYKQTRIAVHDNSEKDLIRDSVEEITDFISRYIDEYFKLTI